MHSTARLSHIKRIPPEAPEAGKTDRPVKDPPHKPQTNPVEMCSIFVSSKHTMPSFQIFNKLLMLNLKSSNIPTNNFQIHNGVEALPRYREEGRGLGGFFLVS
ncbi:hypothetical protein SLA2020_265230 [Shorea laevis]